MPRYDLNTLDAQGFTELCNALLCRVISERVTPGPLLGRDAGIDAWYEKTSKGDWAEWDGAWIFQYKCHNVARQGVDRCRRAIRREVADELDKVYRTYHHRARNYVLITNVPYAATPGSAAHRWFEGVAGEYRKDGLQRFQLWDLDKLNSLLDSHHDLAERYMGNARSRIKELENYLLHQLAVEQPNVVVGFQDETGHLADTLQVLLHPLPPMPDLDLLVEEERRKLVGKAQVSQSSGELAKELTKTAFGVRNRDYERDVERYLPKYRRYLIRQYEYGIAEDRTRPFALIVHNIGYRPANNVKIEFAMPEAFAEPAKHQLRGTLISAEMQERFEISAEKLADLEKYRLCDPPKRPQRFNAVVTLPQFVDLGGGFQGTSQFSSAIQDVTNVRGPKYETRHGVLYIAYDVGQLVPHRLEDDFEPFYVWLGDIDSPATWRIPVRITSADLREPQEQVLTVKMEVV
jgi:hypothetical protein